MNITTELARALQIRGLINIQFVLYDEELYVLEVNPRASRTVPFPQQSDRDSDGTCRHPYQGWEDRSAGARGYPEGLWPGRERRR